MKRLILIAACTFAVSGAYATSPIFMPDQINNKNVRERKNPTEGVSLYCVTFVMDEMRNNYGSVVERKNEFNDITVYCDKQGILDCQASDGTCPDGKAIQETVAEYIRSGIPSGEAYLGDTYFNWDQYGEKAVKISVYIKD